MVPQARTNRVGMQCLDIRRQTLAGIPQGRMDVAIQLPYTTNLKLRIGRSLCPLQGRRQVLCLVFNQHSI